MVEGIEQEYKDLLSATGRCAPPQTTEVDNVTTLHSDLEDLMDISTYTLAAAQHGTPLPCEVQGQPCDGIGDLCDKLELARKTYFVNAKTFLAVQPTEVTTKNVAPAPVAPQSASVVQSEHIVQHLDPGGIVEKVVGAHLILVQDSSVVVRPQVLHNSV